MDSAGTVVVLTALNTEYLAVRTLLQERRRHPHQGTIFEIGRLPGVPGTVALAVIGTGNHAAAALSMRAITAFRPQAVLFVGVAGALHSDLELGTVIVATKVYGYHGGIDEPGGFRVAPQAWEADHELEQRAREVDRTKSWHELLPGQSEPSAVRFRPIAAGEVVLNSETTPLTQQLRGNYPDAAAIEMESAGMAKAAHLTRTPCLAVRGISDKADGNKYAADRAGWQPLAAANAAAFAVAVAKSILIDADDEGEVGAPDDDAEADKQLNNAARALAGAVRRQWQGEAAREWIQPLRLRWSSPDLSLADDGYIDDLAQLFRTLPKAGKPRQLVVLGEAGAGKTVAAREFVLRLVEHPRRSVPVPVLLDVSSWRPDEDDLVLQRHSDEWVAASFVVAEPGLVLASAAPA